MGFFCHPTWGLTHNVGRNNPIMTFYSIMGFFFNPLLNLSIIGFFLEPFIRISILRGRFQEPFNACLYYGVKFNEPFNASLYYGVTLRCMVLLWGLLEGTPNCTSTIGFLVTTLYLLIHIEWHLQHNFYTYIFNRTNKQ